MRVWKIISSAIIKAEEGKLFDLWGEKLVKLQKGFRSFLLKSFKKSYKTILEELSLHPSVRINELLAFLEKEKVQKMIDADDLETCSSFLTKWVNEGIKSIDTAFKDQVKITAGFGIKNDFSIKRAEENAGKLITKVNDYSKKRIGAIITNGVKKWYGYGEIAKELKKDYSFSSYRANLIASNELWEAYLTGQEKKFDILLEKYSEGGWKHWMSHRDVKTSAGCLANDYQGRIEYSKDFQSGHKRPHRFPWCRCSISYRLENPDEERLLPENATQQDLFQTKVPEDKAWEEWVKPEWYDKYSTGILPPSYFNAIGEVSEYVKPKGEAYYLHKWNKINLWNQATRSLYEKQRVEAHEVGHFFFTRAIMTNKDKLEEFKNMFTESLKELQEILHDDEMKNILSRKNKVVKAWGLLYNKFDNLKKNIDYTVEIWEKIEYDSIVNTYILSEKYLQDMGGIIDTIWALTKQQEVWRGHDIRYYYKWNILFKIWNTNITEPQAQEFFAHLNETYFVWNSVIKEILPKTYKAMKNYYKNIWYNFNK